MKTITKREALEIAKGIRDQYEKAGIPMKKKSEMKKSSLYEK